MGHARTVRERIRDIGMAVTYVGALATLTAGLVYALEKGAQIHHGPVNVPGIERVDAE